MAGVNLLDPSTYGNVFGGAPFTTASPSPTPAVDPTSGALTGQSPNVDPNYLGGYSPGWQPAVTPLAGAVGNTYAPITNAQLQGLYALQGQPQVTNAINAGLQNPLSTPTMGGTQINTSQTQPLMSGQVSNINALSALAQGQGPSAADVAAKQALDQQTAQNANILASQRATSNPAGATAALLRANANTAQTAQQAEVAGKVNEELGARSALTGALQGATQQSAQQAQAQATMDYQTKAQNLQSMLQTGQINMQQYQAMTQALQTEYTQASQLASNYGALITNENTSLQGIQKGVATQSSAQQQQLLGAGIGAIGTLAAAGAAASDIKLKDHIKVGHAKVKDFLNNFAPKTTFTLAMLNS